MYRKTANERPKSRKESRYPKYTALWPSETPLMLITHDERDRPAAKIAQPVLSTSRQEVYSKTITNPFTADSLSFDDRSMSVNSQITSKNNSFRIFDGKCNVPVISTELGSLKRLLVDKEQHIRSLQSEIVRLKAQVEELQKTQMQMSRSPTFSFGVLNGSKVAFLEEQNKQLELKNKLLTSEICEMSQKFSQLEQRYVKLAEVRAFEGQSSVRSANGIREHLNYYSHAQQLSSLEKGTSKEPPVQINPEPLIAKIPSSALLSDLVTNTPQKAIRMTPQLDIRDDPMSLYYESDKENKANNRQQQNALYSVQTLGESWKSKLLSPIHKQNDSFFEFTEQKLLG